MFLRGVGEATDIVEKEMYTFLDKGGDSMTLRPEATAGIVRAYLQRGLSSRPQPVKLFMLHPGLPLRPALEGALSRVPSARPRGDRRGRRR